ncbi:LysR substrate-binding domain-containing protein [Serratia sp. NPDC078593]|uniref:LysR family transcriptional regulator n=1 Tax=unclassified Serratia (in: enterobacteria) TaxID=2647522 RepID=UPI0037D52C74
MENLQQITIRTLKLFVAVIELGNFSEVARRAGIAASSVSRVVQQLENALQTQLLYRNTRAVVPTEAGRLFARYARSVLDNINEAQAELQEREREPSGVVRLNAPVVFGQRHIAPWLSELAARFPALNIELVQTDDFIDPHRDATDLIFRIGVLNDSNFHARVFASPKFYLAASPAYLARSPALRQPSDLNQHNCLVYRGFTGAQRWFFLDRDNRWQPYSFSGSLVSNNAETLVTAALNGMGLVVFPDWLIGEALKRGALVHALPDYAVSTTLEPQAIAAIYPNARRPPLKVRAVIDFFVEKYGSPVYWQYE